MITLQAGYALVIDDEPANRDFLERLLQTASFKVVGASSGADGLKAAQALPSLALALVDQQLPDAPGLEIIAKLRALNPEALLVMATVHDDRPLIDRAFASGVDIFLVKPHGFMELYRRLQEADKNIARLRRLIIDQYGPRPYREPEQRKTGEVKAVTAPAEGPPPPVAVAPEVTPLPPTPVPPVPPTVAEPDSVPAPSSTADNAAKPEQPELKPQG
jgi:DNA-binding NarL/FixJ family response regulator